MNLRMSHLTLFILCICFQSIGFGAGKPEEIVPKMKTLSELRDPLNLWALVCGKLSCPGLVPEQGNDRMNSSGKLQALRNAMQNGNYHAFIITTDDEHQSEYISNYDKRREYITGFTGSAGTAVVLNSEAALWTDSRYFIQADTEVDSNWQVMKEGAPTLTEWLISKLERKSRVAADSKLISQAQWQKWASALEPRGINLTSPSQNLVDIIWDKDGRPEQPMSQVFIHDLEFAGLAWETKVERIRTEISRRGMEALVVTSLTEIAWLFNLRGNDVPYVPVFKAFAVVTAEHIKLYINNKKISDKVKTHLNVDRCAASPCNMVVLENYESIYTDLEILKDMTVLLPQSASFAIYRLLNKEKVSLDTTPILDAMVVKNDKEISGMHSAMLKDSVALAEFFAKLETEVKTGVKWSELGVSREIQNFRRKQAHYQGESFQAISAVGSHAAMPHYSPKTSTDRKLETNEIFLLDSGGQYLDGTTDITRTMHFGIPTYSQKEAYTRVLMGHISLASLVFPAGTTDIHVDILTRQALYDSGLDYGHGSGHGVGSFLSVHEYPPLVRLPKTPAEGYAFQPGVFFSIEPGFYQDGEYGVRLESIFTVVEAQTKHKFKNTSFYAFEPVVWIPFEKNLILVELLSKKQIEWLDDYNLNCVEKIRKLLSSEAQSWLISRTTSVRSWSEAPAIRPALLLQCFILLQLFLYNVNRNNC